MCTVTGNTLGENLDELKQNGFYERCRKYLPALGVKVSDIIRPAGSPVFGDAIDLARFGEIGKKGVLALMCDSTNAERPGFTQSEKSVGKVLDGIFEDHRKNRIIIATFASNVDRVQQIINCAEKYGRKVGSTLLPSSLQEICRCSPVLRPVEPVMPTTSLGPIAAPFPPGHEGKQSAQVNADAANRGVPWKPFIYSIGLNCDCVQSPLQCTTL